MKTEYKKDEVQCTLILLILSNVVVEWLIFLFRIREAQDSNLGLEIGYPDLDFRGFPQSLQANVKIIP
jgi:hypothetical protein